MHQEFLFPLDLDLPERELIYTLATEREIHSKLRLSAVDFPLERLRSVSFDAADELLADAVDRPALHYLFHLPFTGSTLLSHWLEAAGWTMIRDPALLAATFQEGALTSAPDNARLGDLALGLLALSLGGKGKIVRTAGYYPEMIPRLTHASPKSKSLFVYASPEFFILQVLKRPERRSDMKKLTTGSRTPLALSDADIAIDYWIWSVTCVLSVEASRTRTIDSSRLRSLDAEELDALHQWFGGDFEAREHPAREFALHAKTGEPFDEAEQEKQLAECRDRHRDEIEAALQRFRDLGGEQLLAGLRQLDVRLSA